MTSEIRTRVFRTVDEIGKDSIDSLSDDPFFTHGWLKTFETAKPINLSPLYITAYHRGKLAAFTPCFYDSTDSYFWFGPMVLPFMKTILNAHTKLLHGQNKFLLSFSPFCYRTKILLKKGPDEAALTKNLIKKIDALCKNQKILFSSFMFVSEFDKNLIDNLENSGYHKYFWRPTLYLDVTWQNFEDYLKSLEKHFRNIVKREIRKCSENGITIEEVSEFKNLSPILSELSANLLAKYNKNIKKFFKPSFYENLSDSAKANTIVFIAKKNDAIIGFSVCMQKGQTLDCFHCGFNYKLLKKTDFTYFNIAYYVPIKWAIQRGIKKIYYRIEAENVKYKRGCKPEIQYNFIKCHNRLLNTQLENYKKIKNKMSRSQKLAKKKLPNMH